MTDEIKLSEMR